MFSAGRVGGEALGDRGGEARLVDDGEVAGLVNSTQDKQTLICALFVFVLPLRASHRYFISASEHCPR